MKRLLMLLPVTLLKLQFCGNSSQAKGSLSTSVAKILLQQAMSACRVQLMKHIPDIQDQNIYQEYDDVLFEVFL